MTPSQRARRPIDPNDHMTFASVDVAATPWVSPVFYVPDEDYNIYWVVRTRLG